MGWNERQRIHHVSCTVHSDPDGTESFEQARKKAEKLVTYAKGLGFDVMYENVDREEE